MREGARRGLLAVVVVLAFLGTLAVQSTVAAWTDPAHVSATASAGTWAVEPVRTCSVEQRVKGVWQPHPTATCQVTSIVPGAAWGYPVTTNRQVTVTFSVVNAPSGNSHRILAEVDLTGALVLGPGQSWATSTVTGYGVVSSTGLPTVRYDFGNAVSGTQALSAQATVVS